MEIDNRKSNEDVETGWSDKMDTGIIMKGWTARTASKLPYPHNAMYQKSNNK